METKTLSQKVKLTLFKVWKKLIYSTRSHNLLNYATLSIKDDEIRKELILFRYQWLDRIYKFVCVLVTLDVVWSLILQFGTKTNDAV